ncbi:MAG: metallophosphoesterase family protein [Thermodesulfobacteriota bacterium]
MKNKYWIAFGDIHMDTAFVNKVEGLSQADGVLLSGDITNHGSMRDVQNIMDRIRAINPKIWAQVGNMDTEEVVTWLEDEGLNVHNKLVSIHTEVKMFAVGYSTPTPFHTPLEVPETVLASWLQKTQDQCRKIENLIFMTHTPPIDTRADCLNDGSHVGSPAVREFIEVVQPDVCITGHIHEAIGEDWIGNCPVINPGMAGKGGYIRVDLLETGLRATLKGVGL